MDKMNETINNNLIYKGETKERYDVEWKCGYSRSNRAASLFNSNNMRMLKEKSSVF